MKEKVFLSVGTNLGDREANCVEAMLHISRFAGVEKVSPLFETEPVGVEGEQPFFINAVCMIANTPPPGQLLSKLQNVEKQMGRKDKGNNKPRVMDLDILFYGETVVETEGLRIPHRLAFSRAFILKPMSLIAPDFRHPVLGETVTEALRSANDGGYIKLWKSRFFPHPPVENSAEKRAEI